MPYITRHSPEKRLKFHKFGNCFLSMAFVFPTKWPFATTPRSLRSDSIRISVEFILHNYLLCDYWNSQNVSLKNWMVLPLRWTVLNEIQVILVQIFIALSDGRASQLNTPIQSLFVWMHWIGKAKWAAATAASMKYSPIRNNEKLHVCGWLPHTHTQWAKVEVEKRSERRKRKKSKTRQSRE